MRIYRALLRLYPASFRAEYGEEMEAIFARRLREASGLPARTAIWAGAVLDIAASAARVHADLLRQDLRYAARSLSRSPGFAATAILVAAVGIGAATATFSILDHVLLRPLPFPEPERLVDLWENQPARGYSRMELSPANFLDWKRMSTSFEGMGAYHTTSANLVGQGEPERLDGAAITSEMFRVLGARPLLGRVFTAEDDRVGAPQALLLSFGLWQGLFGADPAALGRKVMLDDVPYEVVGVMPRDFRFPSRDAEFWTPERFDKDDLESRTNTYVRAVARLRPGISLAGARAEMRLVAARLERAYPKENARTGATVVRMRDELSPRYRVLLVALFGAAIGVLLIACTNLASLLLARALSRRRELSVRAAMGAGRERLVRQLLTESVLLAACGGGLGLVAAILAGPIVARLVPDALPIAQAPPVDLRMLAAALFLTLATGVGFGVVPALRACAHADTGGLREGPRAGAGRRAERLRGVLVVAEVTASVALLVCAGLLLRALWRTQERDPGFRAEGVLTLRTSLPLPKYDPTERRQRFYQRVLTDIRQLPEVSSAAYISFLPMVMRGGVWPVAMNGQPEDRAENETASLRFVTPGFFAALRIPLPLGRDVSETDTRDSPFVAVVSESFARRYWAGENPLGRRFRVALADRTVVGIAGDIRVRGLERDSEPQVYLPSRQVDDGVMPFYIPKDLVVRASASPAVLIPAIREIVARADPTVPVSDVRRLSDIVEADTAPRRVQARVVEAFAAIAFLLAGIGIHGLLAFTVSQRVGEIGVRMALGAQPRDILEMVLRRGVLLSAAGAVLGAVLACAAGRTMQALLAGVSPADAATLAAAAGLSLAMTVAGSLVPAFRAVRVDPLTAIRAE
ncbi:MAG: ABC transporter permease [Acidobacteriota bacterium]